MCPTFLSLAPGGSVTEMGSNGSEIRRDGECMGCEVLFAGGSGERCDRLTVPNSGERSGL